MKLDVFLLIAVSVLLVVFILTDRLVMAGFEPQFKAMELQRMKTSNKLASAKIVYENLNHVRDLVQKNMQFAGQKDSVTPETIFFDFVTTCVNDLKMKLVSCKPSPPMVAGMLTTNGYDLELEGDFFSLGELYSKFENSRRIIAVSTFEVSLSSEQGNENYGLHPAEAVALSGNKSISIKMHVNTYRVRKQQGGAT
jgi:hypothetical protein